MTHVAQTAAAFGVGGVSLVAAVVTFLNQRRVIEMVPASDVTLNLPATWNDGEITRVLQRHQDQPRVLAHAIASIRNRMVLNQDERTAQHRLRLMTSVIEVFKKNQELKDIIHSLQLAEQEFEIKQIENRIRKEDAEARQGSEIELRKLRKQRDELVLKKEIALLNHDIKGVDKAAEPPPPVLSNDQQRRVKRMEIEDKIRDLSRAEEEAVAAGTNEADIRRIRNMYADKRQELREQLSKFLV